MFHPLLTVTGFCLLLQFSHALYHGPRRVQPCSDQMSNWAAEIRCLRNLLQQCDRKYSFFANQKELRERYSHDVSDRNESETEIPLETSPSPPEDVAPSTVEGAKDGIDVEELRQTMANQFNLKLAELESRVGQELTKMEERANSKIQEIKRKSENEIRELNKLINLMTRRVSRFQGNEYIFMEEKVSWYVAKDNCHKWGGHLVTINNGFENTFVKNLHGRLTWIGINDIQKEGEHVWDGGLSSNYRSWKSGQPDNLDHNENCVEQDESGKWSDLFCFLARSYVCER